MINTIRMQGGWVCKCVAMAVCVGSVVGRSVLRAKSCPCMLTGTHLSNSSTGLFDSFVLLF